LGMYGRVVPCHAMPGPGGWRLTTTWHRAASRRVGGQLSTPRAAASWLLARSRLRGARGRSGFLECDARANQGAEFSGPGHGRAGGRQPPVPRSTRASKWGGRLVGDDDWAGGPRAAAVCGGGGGGGLAVRAGQLPCRRGCRGLLCLCVCGSDGDELVDRAAKACSRARLLLLALPRPGRAGTARGWLERS
jgi:hypothetical protein